jgi:hypothetical protein
MIDGDGMWMKKFPSKPAAMAYFRQSPAAVTGRAAQRTSVGAQYAAAS